MAKRFKRDKSFKPTPVKKLIKVFNKSGVVGATEFQERFDRPAMIRERAAIDKAYARKKKERQAAKKKKRGGI